MISAWGSIRKRSEGIYELRYTIDKERVIETVRGTQKDAERRLAVLRLKHEGVTDTQDITLGEFWSVWYEPTLTHLAPSTAHGYSSMWKTHVKPKWGDRVMSSVKPSEVQEWLLTLSRGSAKHVKTFMSIIWNKACMEGLTDTNPLAFRFRLPSKGTSKANNDVLPLSTLESIADALTGEWFEPCYLLAAFAGLRRAECVGVKIEDLEFRLDGFCAVYISRGVQRVEGQTIIVPPKTGDRVAIMKPEHAARLRRCVGSRRDGWLVDDDGLPCNPDTMAQAWRRWFISQPYKFIPFKNLRNSYVTWTLTEGYSVEVVSKMCGHSQQVEYKHYMKPTADDFVEMLKK